MNGGDPIENPDRGKSLLRAISNTGISVLYCHPSLRIIWAENVPRTWSDSDVAGRYCHEFLPGPVAERLTEAKRSALAGATPHHLEISIPGADGAFWYSVWVDPDGDGDGKVQGIVMTAVDITDQKRREQTLKTLLREVAHRSKNLLAIIQSIATQTGRHSTSIDGFLVRFRGRLQSLASSQDLVTSSNWRGADLRDLVLGQVGRYTADPVRSIRFEGERPYLNPNAALHIGLAMHELAVNSVSYGALARPEGVVTVTAELVNQPQENALRLDWSEAVSVGDHEIGQKRFGSVALERVVPASLNGSANLDISGDHVDYTLIIPRGNFEIE
jgi:two-component sensor histidine kinase